MSSSVPPRPKMPGFPAGINSIPLTGSGGVCVLCLFRERQGDDCNNRRKNMRVFERFSLLALALMICGSMAIVTLGQAVYGSVFGTVTDANGAAVPNATVTITNIGTNVSETAKTNASGN